MNKKIKHSLLDTEELDLLSELLSQEDTVDFNKFEYSLNSSAEGESLLLQLARAGGLKLSTNYFNHQIVFPVQIKAGDFATLTMTLKPPEIFEIGKALRSWRFLAENKNIYLGNEDGDETPFKIHDFSASGVSLLMGEHEQADFPAVLENVFLFLPNRGKLALPRLQISRCDKKTVAYSLVETTDSAILASLCEYLFECHSEQYPEAGPK